MGITVSCGATIFHKQREMEIVMHVSTIGIKSRHEALVRPLKRLRVKPLKFENIIEISGHALDSAVDLEELGIIKRQDNDAEIDFVKISKLEQNMVILKVKRKVDPEIINKLIIRHIHQLTDEQKNNKNQHCVELCKG